MEMRLWYHSVVHLLVLGSSLPLPSLPLGSCWICRSSKSDRDCKDKARKNWARFHCCVTSHSSCCFWLCLCVSFCMVMLYSSQQCLKRDFQCSICILGLSWLVKNTLKHYVVQKSYSEIWCSYFWLKNNRLFFFWSFLVGFSCLFLSVQFWGLFLDYFF